MTELLEQAVDHLRALPPEQQDEVALLLLRLADVAKEPVPLSTDEQAAIAASKAAANRGDFASDEDIRAVWATFDP